MEGAGAAVLAAAIARARRGDEEAFRLLVVSHAGAVFRLAFRLTGNEEDADEVVQETFLKAWKALDRFREGASLATWLYAIAANAARDLLRRRKTRRTDRGEETLESLADAAPSPERTAASAQLSSRVRRAMSRLSDHERAAFVLRHLEGRPIVEIAEALGVANGAARHSVFRAVAKLREELLPFVRSA